MDAIKTMHHLDDYLDDIECKNETVKKMMEEMRLARKKTKEKLSQQNGIGLLDIFSSLCARHPSINSINVKELNYYQLIDQFQRLCVIDNYNANIDALTFGNLSEEAKQKMKHYTSKLD